MSYVVIQTQSALSLVHMQALSRCFMLPILASSWDWNVPSGLHNVEASVYLKTSTLSTTERWWKHAMVSLTAVLYPVTA